MPEMREKDQVREKLPEMEEELVIEENDLDNNEVYKENLIMDDDEEPEVIEEEEAEEESEEEDEIESLKRQMATLQETMALLFDQKPYDMLEETVITSINDIRSRVERIEPQFQDLELLLQSINEKLDEGETVFQKAMSPVERKEIEKIDQKVTSIMEEIGFGEALDVAKIPPNIIEIVYQSILDDVVSAMWLNLGAHDAESAIRKTLENVRLRTSGSELFRFDGRRIIAKDVARSLENRLISARQIQTTYEELLSKLLDFIPRYKAKNFRSMIKVKSQEYAVDKITQLLEGFENLKENVTNINRITVALSSSITARIKQVDEGLRTEMETSRKTFENKFDELQDTISKTQGTVEDLEETDDVIEKVNDLTLQLAKAQVELEKMHKRHEQQINKIEELEKTLMKMEKPAKDKPKVEKKVDKKEKKEPEKKDEKKEKESPSKKDEKDEKEGKLDEKLLLKTIKESEDGSISRSDLLSTLVLSKKDEKKIDEIINSSQGYDKEKVGRGMRYTYSPDAPGKEDGKDKKEGKKTQKPTRSKKSSKSIPEPKEEDKKPDKPPKGKKKKGKEKADKKIEKDKSKKPDENDIKKDVPMEHMIQVYELVEEDGVTMNHLKKNSKLKYTEVLDALNTLLEGEYIIIDSKGRYVTYYRTKKSLGGEM